MKKTITIDEKDVLLKSTAGTAIRYKAQFRRDMFADILSLGVLSSYISTDGDQNNIDLSQVDLSKLDFEVIYNLVWAFAKTANKEVQDPLTWLDTFGEFPIAEIITEIQDLIKSTVQSKKK
ncbi:prophage pi2 protein 40 [Bacillus thuringiensis MC28]|nr:prophage pi2 protein 40 [Bacillus thuringiensis MC28]